MITAHSQLHLNNFARLTNLSFYMPCYFSELCVCLLQSLVREPLSKRRALLRESFEEKEGEFVFARSLDSDNTDVIAEFLEQSVRGL